MWRLEPRTAPLLETDTGVISQKLRCWRLKTAPGGCATKPAGAGWDERPRLCQVAYAAFVSRRDSRRGFNRPLTSFIAEDGDVDAAERLRVVAGEEVEDARKLLRGHAGF